MKIIIECASIEELHALRQWLPADMPGQQPVPVGDPIAVLDLSVRSVGGLKALGVSTVQQLTDLCARELQLLPNMGRKSINEIRAALASRGLHLVGEECKPSC